jgi:Cu2+-exporting ATPase/Cu+-exporting ATPase
MMEGFVLIQCAHCCSAIVPGAASEDAGQVFCCAGCLTVYQLLHASNLADYYTIRDRTESSHSFLPPLPATPAADFLYLDDPGFQVGHSGGCRYLDFYVEGIQCTACVWLLESLDRLCPDIAQSRFRTGPSVLRLFLSPTGRFSAAASAMVRLGYRPHLVDNASQASQLQAEENRRELIRVAIAGACAGNMMLFSVALYAGATEQMAQLFLWAILLLAVPVMGYCAIPFYKSALAAVRRRRMSVDVPIVAALGIGVAAGIRAVVLGQHSYFDSLAMLIFLLLASRYWLRRIHQSHLQDTTASGFLVPPMAKKRGSDGVISPVLVAALQSGDELVVAPGEVFAADGVLAEGTTAANCAAMTGESYPQQLQVGASVYAGTVNLTATVVIRVSAVGEKTRMGQLLAGILSYQKSKIETLADRWAMRVLGMVTVLALVLFLALGYSGYWEEGFRRALALVIITCPCASAIATPLAFSLGLNACQRRGILVKGGDVLERMESVKQIVLDKTGTVTQGDFIVTNWPTTLTDRDDLRSIAALESRSAHPVSHAIRRYILISTLGDGLAVGTVCLLGSVDSLPEVDDFAEKIGWGVSGTVNGHIYQIGKSTTQTSRSETTVSVWKEGEWLGDVVLGDAIRAESKASVDALRKEGFEITLLSGDRRDVVERVGRELGLAPKQCLSDQTPELKLAYVQSHPAALMVGDGANDAAALSRAYVGVAVHGSVEVSMQAADVYVASPGISPVVTLVTVAGTTMRCVRRNLVASALYNGVGISLALAGWMTPLGAALLMPFSSVTVLSVALLTFRRWRS